VRATCSRRLSVGCLIFLTVCLSVCVGARQYAGRVCVADVPLVIGLHAHPSFDSQVADMVRRHSEALPRRLTLSAVEPLCCRQKCKHAHER
jgi:hypothetical protein